MADLGLTPQQHKTEYKRHMAAYELARRDGARADEDGKHAHKYYHRAIQHRQTAIAHARKHMELTGHSILDESTNVDHEREYFHRSERAMYNHSVGRHLIAAVHQKTAEDHAKSHFQKTGKKIVDQLYTGSSKYISQVSSESVNEASFFKPGKLTHKHDQPATDDELKAIHSSGVDTARHYARANKLDPSATLPSNPYYSSTVTSPHRQKRREAFRRGVQYGLNDTNFDKRFDESILEQKISNKEAADHYDAEVRHLETRSASQVAKWYGPNVKPAHAQEAHRRNIAINKEKAEKHRKLFAELGEATEPKSKNARIQAWHWAGAKKAMAAKYGFDHTLPISQIPTSMEHGGKTVNPKRSTIWVAQQFANKDKQKGKTST